MRSWGVAWFIAPAVLCTALIVPPAGGKPAPDRFAGDARPFLQKFCYGCHSGPNATAGLDLSKYKSDAQVLAASAIWRKVAQFVGNGHMPPEGSLKPNPGQRQQLVTYIDRVLDSDLDCRLADPGRVTIRRLNRAEYDNTIRDLTGVDAHLSDDFPSDDVGYGFDNIGDVLSLSPLLFEKYFKAAQRVAGMAISAPEARLTTYSASRMAATVGVADHDGGWNLYSNGQVGVRHAFPLKGRYRVRIAAWGMQAGPEPCKMGLNIDGLQVAAFDVRAANQRAENYEFPVEVSAGVHEVAATFLNDYYKPNDPNPGNRDRNLVVMSVAILGPDGSAVMPSAILPPGSTIAELRPILARFAARAFRRPAKPEEVDRLVALAKQAVADGESLERGVQLAVTACLVSPSFLFRVELDPTSPASKHDISQYELASRLSYFLWSSMPDAELTDLASRGELAKSGTLQSQVRRMLASPKAQALSENFAAQWLQLRKLQTIGLDTNQFPEFSEKLRASMIGESKAYFADVVRQDRSVLELLDSNYTWVDSALARLYGLRDATWKGFQRVDLPDGRRGGVLTQASVLTVTSNPTRTSPVKRGKWVLENLLGTPPPPPPPGVGNLQEERVLDAKTLRERMEQHRKKPECAVCHNQMDAIGFSLENFDPMGRWRDSDQGQAIDPSGVLGDGTRFSGAQQLRKILMSRKDAFVRCLAEKLLTYAIGRGMTEKDACHLDAIVKSTKLGNYRFSALVDAVVASEPFLKQGAKK